MANPLRFDRRDHQFESDTPCHFSMENHISYNEDDISHQTPFTGVSEWQEYNDVEGIFSTSLKLEDERCIEEKEANIR